VARDERGGCRARHAVFDQRGPRSPFQVAAYVHVGYLEPFIMFAVLIGGVGSLGIASGLSGYPDEGSKS